MSKKIVISEDDLAKVCATIVAEEDTSNCVKEVGIIFLAKLGATLFDGVEDGDTVVVKCRKRHSTREI